VLTTCPEFHVPCTYLTRWCTDGVQTADASHALSTVVRIIAAKQRFSMWAMLDLKYAGLQFVQYEEVDGRLLENGLSVE
jgi:hypothetical protein